MAISHNASGLGMLLVTATTLEVGAQVNIVVQLPPEGSEEKKVSGRVVRVEKNLDDPEGIPGRIAWPSSSSNRWQSSTRRWRAWPKTASHAFRSSSRILSECAAARLAHATGW